MAGSSAGMIMEAVKPRWDGFAIVACTGESLTTEAAELCRGHHVIAVNEAHERIPSAEVLYAHDARWWKHYEGCPKFQGERWTCDDRKHDAVTAKYDLHYVAGREAPGFSTDPRYIHYNRCSGAQAINLALHFLRGPAKRVILIGLDLTGGYFYGKQRLSDRHFGHFINSFNEAAKLLDDRVTIVNCGDDRVLRCFPCMPLERAIERAKRRAA